MLIPGDGRRLVKAIYNNAPSNPVKAAPINTAIKGKADCLDGGALTDADWG
jgi:hypothetical protein